ncbi:antA/AntB antirepressor family protein [Lacticaseibacillus nasuensis]|uniref:Antirepresssor i n=2 Tax=Lacticaseibacillus TaxID=2759736 RepID=A0A0R1JT86_9LACO|nr:antA/AntB antirepressor family protein [Lacticaseibacillus nasuensis]KRK71881.1 antirepresssor i [Lacticaseibacillus nasuensis JCM 17158]
MNELIKVTVNEKHQQVVSARELYKGLEIKKRFSGWVEQNFGGFEEGVDFTTVPQGTVVISGNGTERRYDDYALTIDMAKNLALMSRTQQGAQYRAYLIEIERKWNDPQEVIKRGYEYLKDENVHLKIENRSLTAQTQLMAPKAAYFDELVERNTLTNFRDTAKMLGKHQKQFINWLLERRFIYRDSRGAIKPRAAYANTYFTIKDNRQGYPQTLITPNGRSAFQLLLGDEEVSA